MLLPRPKHRHRLPRSRSCDRAQQVLVTLTHHGSAKQNKTSRCPCASLHTRATPSPSSHMLLPSTSTVSIVQSCSTRPRSSSCHVVRVCLSLTHNLPVTVYITKIPPGVQACPHRACRCRIGHPREYYSTTYAEDDKRAQRSWRRRLPPRRHGG